MPAKKIVDYTKLAPFINEPRLSCSCGLSQRRISVKVGATRFTHERLTMKIKELSANIDQKLNELEQQLDNLHAERTKTSDPEQQQKLTADITALNKVKLKLLKSKDIAWRAHQLLSDQENQRSIDRQRLWALAFLTFSALGAITLIGIYFWSGWV